MAKDKANKKVRQSSVDKKPSNKQNRTAKKNLQKAKKDIFISDEQTSDKNSLQSLKKIKKQLKNATIIL